MNTECLHTKWTKHLLIGLLDAGITVIKELKGRSEKGISETVPKKGQNENEAKRPFV